MLEPHARQHLLELLRPPSGYVLDEAIGTTFSLDLLALLSAPLAFALFDWEDSEGRPTADPPADPLALLQAVRSYADKITIFCQAARIVVPPKSHRLFSYLESSVVEVGAKTTAGVFHPKLWVMRFSRPDGSVLYRVLCLSRNLTFDQSWDTALVLEGDLNEQAGTHATTAPLADFVAALPDLALRPPAPEVHARIARLQAELRQVMFQCPPGFDRLSFWPLGHTSSQSSPFEGVPDRMLIISPFLTEGFLERLLHQSRTAILISRLEALQTLLPETISAFEAVYVLHPHASAETTDELPEYDGDALADNGLSGLHAKLYIVEQGDRAAVFTGSANATSAAFSTNIELLVELQGPRACCGIEALLTPPHTEATLQTLLARFTPGDPVIDPAAAQREMLERLVNQCALHLAQARLEGHVFLDQQTGHFVMQIAAAAPIARPWPAALRVRCRPTTLEDHRAVTVTESAPELARFEALQLQDLTSFLAVEIQAAERGVTIKRQFVLNLALHGLPADRQEQMLRLILRNREDVLRLLLFLLAGDSAAARDALMQSRWLEHASINDRSVQIGFPLLEALMRALDTNPEKIVHVSRLVEDLRQTAEGRELLPDHFAAVWEPIWDTYQRRRR